MAEKIDDLWILQEYEQNFDQIIAEVVCSSGIIEWRNQMAIEFFRIYSRIPLPSAPVTKF